jgi:hypothetical protein
MKFLLRVIPVLLLTLSISLPAVSAAASPIQFGALPKKTFGDPAFSLTATSTSLLPITFDSSNTGVATVSGNSVTITGAGSTTISASQGTNSVKRVLQVNKASQTITFAPIPQQVFSGSSFSLGLSASAPSLSTVTFTSSNAKVASISGSSLTVVGAGVAMITAKVPASSNYNAAVARQSLKVVRPAPTPSPTPKPKIPTPIPTPTPTPTPAPTATPNTNSVIEQVCPAGNPTPASSRLTPYSP